MGAISLRNVVKRYGFGPKANAVIHGVSADIADGEFVVIVGPSGCGKSTLLRMVAGLEEITGGEISIAGRVVNNLEPSERDIAMVFQNYALYPHMSVFDNMAYGLKIAKVPMAEIKARVDKAAAILELAPFLLRKPRELSGGQRQRVAMGRAIVRQPAVFLFDEPLSNLDAKLRAQTRLEIQKLHRELRTTSLFVTHDQVEAMTLAERMIVMNAGRMEQIGTPDEVYHRPATTFVAGFIGSPPMNLVHGATDGAAFKAGGQLLPLPRPAPRAGELVLGIRPEHVELSFDLQASGWPLRVHAPENTLAAFRLGASFGYRAFECDVKLSADGVPFLLHDATLQRTTSGHGRAADLSWSELARLDVGAWHSRQFAGEPPASLDGIAAFCLENGHALNIEIKPTPGSEAETGRVVAEHCLRLWRGAALPPLFSSFQPAALAAAQAAAPAIPRALLLDSLRTGWLDEAKALGCVAVVANYAVMDAAVLAELH